MTIIGTRIKELRQAKSMTKAELAKSMGVSTLTITNYENGKFLPIANKICKLCKCLESTADYLLGISDSNVKTNLR